MTHMHAAQVNKISTIKHAKQSAGIEDHHGTNKERTTLIVKSEGEVVNL
jgi:hypothetical protein